MSHFPSATTDGSPQQRPRSGTRVGEQPPANIFLYAPRMRTELPDPPLALTVLPVLRSERVLGTASATESSAESIGASSEPSSAAAAAAAAALASKAVELGEEERSALERLAVCVEGMRPAGGMWLLELAAAFADTLDVATAPGVNPQTTALPWTYRPLQGAAAELVRNESALAAVYAPVASESNENRVDQSSLARSLEHVALGANAMEAALPGLSARNAQWMRPPQYDEFLSLKAGGAPEVSGVLRPEAMAHSTAEGDAKVHDSLNAAALAADALAVEAEFEAATQLDENLAALKYPHPSPEKRASGGERLRAIKSFPIVPDEQLWEEPCGLLSFLEVPMTWQTHPMTYGVAQVDSTVPTLVFFGENLTDATEAQTPVDRFAYQLDTPESARELAGFVCLHFSGNSACLAPVSFRVRPQLNA
jgi:hypothetical protein